MEDAVLRVQRHMQELYEESLYKVEEKHIENTQWLHDQMMTICKQMEIKIKLPNNAIDLKKRQATFSIYKSDDLKRRRQNIEKEKENIATNMDHTPLEDNLTGVMTDEPLTKALKLDEKEERSSQSSTINNVVTTAESEHIENVITGLREEQPQQQQQQQQEQQEKLLATNTVEQTSSPPKAMPSKKKKVERKMPEELNIDVLKVVELRKELKQRGLKTAGVKAILVARLKDAIEEEKKVNLQEEKEQEEQQDVENKESSQIIEEKEINTTTNNQKEDVASLEMEKHSQEEVEAEVETTVLLEEPHEEKQESSQRKSMTLIKEETLLVKEEREKETVNAVVEHPKLDQVENTLEKNHLLEAKVSSSSFGDEVVRESDVGVERQASPHKSPVSIKQERISMDDQQKDQVVVEEMEVDNHEELALPSSASSVSSSSSSSTVIAFSSNQISSTVSVSKEKQELEMKKALATVQPAEEERISLRLKSLSLEKVRLSNGRESIVPESQEDVEEHFAEQNQDILKSIVPEVVIQEKPHVSALFKEKFSSIDVSKTIAPVIASKAMTLTLKKEMVVVASAQNQQLPSSQHGQGDHHVTFAPLPAPLQNRTEAINHISTSIPVSNTSTKEAVSTSKSLSITAPVATATTATKTLSESDLERKRREQQLSIEREAQRLRMAAKQSAKKRLEEAKASSQYWARREQFKLQQQKQKEKEVTPVEVVHVTMPSKSVPIQEEQYKTAKDSLDNESMIISTRKSVPTPVAFSSSSTLMVAPASAPKRMESSASNAPPVPSLSINTTSETNRGPIPPAAPRKISSQASASVAKTPRLGLSNQKNSSSTIVTSSTKAPVEISGAMMGGKPPLTRKNPTDFAVASSSSSAPRNSSTIGPNSRSSQDTVPIDSKGLLSSQSSSKSTTQGVGSSVAFAKSVSAPSKIALSPSSAQTIETVQRLVRSESSSSVLACEKSLIPKETTDASKSTPTSATLMTKQNETLPLASSASASNSERELETANSSSFTGPSAPVVTPKEPKVSSSNQASSVSRTTTVSSSTETVTSTVPIGQKSHPKTHLISGPAQRVKSSTLHGISSNVKTVSSHKSTRGSTASSISSSSSTPKPASATTTTTTTTTGSGNSSSRKPSNLVSGLHSFTSLLDKENSNANSSNSTSQTITSTNGNSISTKVPVVSALKLAEKNRLLEQKKNLEKIKRKEALMKKYEEQRRLDEEKKQKRIQSAIVSSSSSSSNANHSHTMTFDHKKRPMPTGASTPSSIVSNNNNKNNVTRTNGNPNPMMVRSRIGLGVTPSGISSSKSSSSQMSSSKTSNHHHTLKRPFPSGTTTTITTTATATKKIKDHNHSVDGPTNYEMSDHGVSPSDDEEESLNSSDEEKKNSKKIPKWAQRDHLEKILKKQFGPNAIDPTPLIFPDFIDTCDLEAIFFDPNDIGKKKKKFLKRTSSGNWLADRPTAREKAMYKREMGFQR